MRCLFVSWFAIALVASPARGDVREDARQEFAAGQAADARSDWATAIEHYLRANDLVPHPFTIYNIVVIAETGVRYYRGEMAATLVPVTLTLEAFLRTAD